MAKSDVGTLTVYLESVTTQFDQGLNRAESKMEGFKGKIGGLSKTWTEMSSKVRLVASAFEVGFGAIATTLDVFKGDWESAAETVKSLPIVGGLATQMETFVLSYTGMADAIADVENRMKSISAETARAQKAFEDYRKAIKDSELESVSLADDIAVLEETLKNGAEAGRALAQEIVSENQIREIEDNLAAVEKVVREAWEEIRAHDQFDDEGNSLWEPLMSGDRRRELDQTIARQSRIAEQLREQLSLAIKKADLEAAVADSLNAQADADADRLRLSQSISALESKRTQAMGASVAGKADTFGTPMGTIRLPSMSTAVELARKQLTELSSIDAELKQLRSELKALAA